MQFAKSHFLDARGDLTDLRSWIAGKLNDACAAAAGHLNLKPIDIVVRAGQFVIPEKGHVGHAQPGVIFITVDPSNPALRENKNHSLERMMVHELHHAARWDDPGCGSTLGECLVTEGLAGHFAQEVYGQPVEPWEDVDLEAVRSYVSRAAKEWDDESYNHNEWFYGGGDLPRWVGYSLGFQIVKSYLSRNANQCASRLAHVNAAVFQTSLNFI